MTSGGELTARRLSASGVGALSVWRVPRDCGLVLRGRRGATRAWPDAGEVIVAQVMDGAVCLDEGVVVGVDGRDADLFLHGGEGVDGALQRALVERGVALASSPSAGPSSWRASVAQASAERGVLRELIARCERGPLDDELRNQAARVLHLAPFAERLVTPAVVRLVGRPNAGKSTLFNALLGRRRVLVSPVAGTTRDAVRAPFVVHGVPVALEDTAGVAAGEVLDASGAADLVVHVTAEDWPDGAGDGALVVRTHADRRALPSSDGALDVSGLTADGVAELGEAIATRLAIPDSTSDDVWVPLRASDRARLAAVLSP